MRFRFFIIVYTILSCSISIAQEIKNYSLDSIVVTANRVPSSLNQVGRSIVTISESEIELLPATDIQDVLEIISGLDLKQRGPEGIQGDVSIRGGSFEQTLIMIDGIKLIDPQTGHHNMNIPISFSQIERIEILKGQGSRTHGANAFSGAINVIPKRKLSNGLDVELSGGENNYHKVGLNGSAVLGTTVHRVSVNRSKSDGYRENTEFENYNVSINNSFNLNESVINTIFGYSHKDFGANSYYTTRFPNQAEKTRTLLGTVSAEFSVDELIISPKVYWRNNEDVFVLNKFDPSFYKNNHETNVYGGEIQASTDILGGATSFGIEFNQDNIISNNLGEHKRQRKGFFIEQKVNLSENFNFSMGGFAYYYSNIDWKFWPGVDVAYNPSKNIKLFANYGNAFRIPTYTELYYSDPITLGNSNLVPEESTNYEIGFSFEESPVNLTGSYFIKEGKNLIDYVFDIDEEIWTAENFSEIYTDGFEIAFSANFNDPLIGIVKRFSMDYTYLNSDKADLDLNSRYALEYLRHDLSIKLFHALPFGINQSWTVNYEDRITLGDHFTVDSKISRQFSQFNIFVSAKNIFNKSYEEIPGVPLPGRWIITGLKLKLL